LILTLTKKKTAIKIIFQQRVSFGLGQGLGAGLFFSFWIVAQFLWHKKPDLI
jgi:hypothetical protein